MLILSFDLSARSVRRWIDHEGLFGRLHPTGTARCLTLYRFVHEDSFDVFLDLKFHDIPNTVARAAAAAADLGVWMLNVHAGGGSAMMRAAREALGNAADRPLLTAVTVLTSMGDEDLAEVGYQGTALDRVLGLAQLASESGLDGVVCSAREALALRQVVPRDFALVTPGIRLTGDESGDQKRGVEPTEAGRCGADFLVMGRSITGADDPQQVVRTVLTSLQSV